MEIERNHGSYHSLAPLPSLSTATGVPSRPIPEELPGTSENGGYGAVLPVCPYRDRYLADTGMTHLAPNARQHSNPLCPRNYWWWEEAPGYIGCGIGGNVYTPKHTEDSCDCEYRTSWGGTRNRWHAEAGKIEQGRPGDCWGALVHHGHEQVLQMGVLSTGSKWSYYLGTTLSYNRSPRIHRNTRRRSRWRSPKPA